MISGLLGTKLGMTQIFMPDGSLIPCTAIEVGPCWVIQIKTQTHDGYDAIQVGFGARKAKRTTRAEAGHASKAGLELAPRTLREFRVSEPSEYEAGQELTVGQFEAGDRVKVTGTSRGRGFQGVVKRHGFRGRPASHGHPGSRVPGSMGPGTDPSRVIKGKKLPGQMGDVRHTEKSCRVMRVDGERNLLFIRGGLPGSRNGVLFIREA